MPISADDQDALIVVLETGGWPQTSVRRRHMTLDLYLASKFDLEG
jgi:hypothetical protein